MAAIKAKAGNARLIAVTKNRDLPTIREALACGITAIGENRVQEAEEKLPGLDCEKHFIGHLQSNKVKRAAALFDCIQSIDSVRLARKVDACEKPMRCMVQVNTSGKQGQHGASPEETVALCGAIKQMPNLNLIGLMTIADIENPRPCFQRLFELNQRTALPHLSMGMSDDYEIALEEGSTMLRLGKALFG